MPPDPDPLDGPPDPELPPEVDGWQRLDPRMLLVSPVKELWRFWPLLVGALVAGSSTEGPPYELLGIAFPIVLGVLHYVTTGYRIVGGRIELRHGLLSRHVLSVQLDRVRTVDLTATLLHRALGLSLVKVGTGSAGGPGHDLELDSLSTEQAHELRYSLLHATNATNAVVDPDAPEPAPPVARTVVRLDPLWARYAPLTGVGLAIFGAILGVGGQALDAIGFFEDEEQLPTLDVPWGLLGPVLLVLTGVVICVLAVAAYLVVNWDLTLTHTSSDGSWHLRRGLFTTRETSIDATRIRGVRIGEPLGLRAVGAGTLHVIATGLSRTADNGSVAAPGSLLVPPAPREVVRRVAGEVLDRDEPLAVELAPHGPAATRRRWIRALVLPVLAVLALVALVATGDVSAWWLVPAVLVVLALAGVAHDRSRSLGHALTDTHLVVRQGSLTRSRVALETDGIIAWTWQSSWFQRRVGLATLTVATAGGSRAYEALDIPLQRSVEVALAADPALLEQFLRA